MNMKRICVLVFVLVSLQVFVAGNAGCGTVVLSPRALLQNSQKNLDLRLKRGQPELRSFCCTDLVLSTLKNHSVVGFWPELVGTAEVRNRPHS
jgi:hypothetical protein